jgi:hypothetical protein
MLKENALTNHMKKDPITKLEIPKYRFRLANIKESTKGDNQSERIAKEASKITKKKNSLQNLIKWLFTKILPK